MSIAELLLIALSLSMDAFAAAVCKGLTIRKLTAGNALYIGVWFGGFQALMPIIGYYLGSHLAGFIQMFSHLISFVLLAAIGIHMLREAFINKKRTPEAKTANSSSLSFESMLIMAVATSIDSLAVGITLAFLNASMLPAVLTIGMMTFTLSAAGAVIGHAFGAKYEFTAEIFGGVILCLLGIKILLEHFGLF